MKRRTLRRGLAATLGIGALAVAGTASGAPDPTYPHLPEVSGQLQGVKTDTISYVETARQWVHVPVLTMAADVETLSNIGVPASSCVKRYGTAMCTPPSDPRDDRLVIHAWAYPVTKANPVTESRFADFPPVTVRMVAFGSIPVQATVRLSLPLDDEGLPVGLLEAGTTDQYQNGRGPHGAEYPLSYDVISDSTVTGSLVVRISDLSVDGVPVAVGDDCRTVSPAPLRGTGLGFVRPPGNAPVPSGHYSPLYGGRVDATLDVPRFTGCGTGGDDLDPLVSAMASGDGFPVVVSQGKLGFCWGPPNSIMDNCGPAEPLSFPARTAD